jgi:hypothetical protein
MKIFSKTIQKYYLLVGVYQVTRYRILGVPIWVKSQLLKA